MTTGMRRGETALVWPEALVRPTDSLLVYLDQKQWVELARAAAGHRDGMSGRRGAAKRKRAWPSQSICFLDLDRRARASFVAYR